uniref:Uncharacterized protein n=1 Tax=Anguilla anguilla TaxID=7936 RepID=A0A0E9XGH1_ANGAN
MEKVCASIVGKSVLIYLFVCFFPPKLLAYSLRQSARRLGDSRSLVSCT